MRRALIALSFLITYTTAADTVIKYGANVAKDDEPLGSTKAFFVAEQEHWFGPFTRQYEFGGWFDNSGVSGRRNSALIGASLGVNVNAGYLYGQALFGPALISRTDSNLGGHLQFNTDVAVGLRDPKSGNTIGLAYKHVSSAGLASPNKGRDLIMFRVSIPW